MSQPTRFWRFSYDTEADVQRMVSEGTLLPATLGLRSQKYDPDDCVARRVRTGDGVFLAKYDPDLGVGTIVAIGVFQNQKPANRVSWKSMRKTVSPNPQGGVPPWRERCFLFEGTRAEAYNFAADFQIHFPGV
ncbi:hypothetical protein HZ992_15210 [Rhizobacter sp. AJA081-3]|uniref:hypothetical protein n=1 Tax=Rhizobacter sp. AJA081-3 TaxID=2753607 RepID=UPI001AE0C5B0|nr:hypothetical protein [Rhizobacter sp. AJA081-3]QTN21530.1 hypothetical protein HZ992_15210 [Rhizobacter sp. AJA081-3]